MKCGQVEFIICDCKKGVLITKGESKVSTEVCAVCMSPVADVEEFLKSIGAKINTPPPPSSNYSDKELIRHIEHYYPILDNSLAELLLRFSRKVEAEND